MRVQNDEVSGKIRSAERSEMGKQKAGFKDGRAVPQLALSLKLKGQKCSTLSGVLCTASSIWRRGKKTIAYVVVVHRLWQDLLAEFLKRTADSKETKKFPSTLGCPCFYGFVCVHVKAVHANRKTVAFQMELLDKFPVEGGQKDPKRRIIPFLPGKS